VLSRVDPWEDHWLFSGIQRIFRRVTEEQLAKLARDLRRPGNLRLADDDPLVQQGFETQSKFHAAWMDFFADEEVLFATGAELEAA
jgi:hypothetical protein